MRTKENRFGEYLEVVALLQVGHKTYRVRQRTGSLDKLGSVWRLTRRQMISILKNTRARDWLINGLETFESYRIDYDNERGIFEVWNIALDHFDLKPSKSLVVVLRK